jgi:antitoxin MazE
MSITLQGWNDGVGLRLPERLLEQLGLKEGSEVSVTVEGHRLVIQSVHRCRYTMAEVLEGFTPNDQPGEVDWGRRLAARSGSDLCA